MANSAPNIFAFIALLGLVPVDLGALRALAGAARRGRSAAIAAWLLLPPIGLDLPGFPDYTKATAATAGILLGTFVFESNRLLTFRLRWFDLPMLLWSLCPFVSSISNDLGPTTDYPQRSGKRLAWFLPYLVGRLYLTDVEDMRELALGMIIGGVCLIPLCLFEIQDEPPSAGQWSTASATGRGHGTAATALGFSSSAALELGLWMNAVTLVAWWLWRTGQLKRLLEDFAAVRSLPRC